MRSSLGPHSGSIRLRGLVLALVVCASAAVGQQVEGRLMRKAKVFVDHLAHGQIEFASAMVDPVVASQTLTPAAIERAWRSYQARYGPYKGDGRALVEIEGAYTIVYVAIQFERKSFDMKLYFNQAENIAGLSFDASKNQAPVFAPPAYTDESLLLEVPFTVVNGEFRLPGTLTLPRVSVPVPAVLLVPDTGRSDRDETYGPNKPLRDVAWGLAAQGIASLRYEKRTRAYARDIGIYELTYEEEFVDDAVVAIRQLSKDDRLDEDRLFILGHGLGGQLAPEIARRSQSLRMTSPPLFFGGSVPVAGIVAMAGSARPLDQITLDFLNHIANRDGVFTLEERNAVLEFQSSIEAMMQSKDENFPPVMGLTYNYLKALNDYDCLRAAQKLKMPIFIAQGGRDHRVTVANDFQIWKDALADHENASFKLYPALDHLFMPGKGPVDLEYAEPGHVDEEFVRDIVAWIRSIETN